MINYISFSSLYLLLTMIRGGCSTRRSSGYFAVFLPAITLLFFVYSLLFWLLLCLLNENKNAEVKYYLSLNYSETKQFLKSFAGLTLELHWFIVLLIFFNSHFNEKFKINLFNNYHTALNISLGTNVNMTTPMMRPVMI